MVEGKVRRCAVIYIWGCLERCRLQPNHSRGVSTTSIVTLFRGGLGDEVESKISEQVVTTTSTDSVPLYLRLTE